MPSSCEETMPPRRLPAKSRDTRSGRAGAWLAVLVFQFLVGVYGGYFGAGIGILMLAAFGYLGFTNIHHMNALKNLNAMCINGVAAGLFIGKGLVDWRLALLMAAGAILGGYAVPAPHAASANPCPPRRHPHRIGPLGLAPAASMQ